ncbi:hypothetical protein GGTG_09027 [Gaeumannomyces tritici R3-111a-1]|uniref:Ribosomal protein S21 n=1 Tax=Gaeumannomyces tritici (strain R3-111a-1) TaxID=644352 RepID=J3P686_GAET3|nr:hypothetical protein GGTG_09027 [Gaeumannomyces tritici R3-111a-1]EJT72160.1 hypothetical protein GGTG_09027 [Gaeumannomyces tritici R3-111a-1]
MEVRHAVQGVLRLAAFSRTASPAALLAPRHHTPFLSAIRHQSTAAAAAAAPGTPTQTPAREATDTPSWLPPGKPDPSETTPGVYNTPSWARRKSPTASSGGGTIGGGTRTVMDRLSLPRDTGSNPLSAYVSNNVMTRAPGAYFSVNDFMGPPEERERRRLVPSLGREVPVNARVDPARAFALLSMSVRYNKMPKDVRLQRFHERPGIKRKRLKMERWRARFKYSFRHTVNRVRELAKQGW